jgi:hypothetical protein
MLATAGRVIGYKETMGDNPSQKGRGESANTIMIYYSNKDSL